MQTTAHLLLVRPERFGFNPQTAASNAFQRESALEADDLQAIARQEADGLAQALREAGCHVNVIFDTPAPPKPDAVFPNNWVSFHESGMVALYPMFAEARRWERRRGVLEMLDETYRIDTELDLTFFEEDSAFLEGTGSMVLDRERKVAYACLSERTSTEALTYFCDRTGYRPLSFEAVDAKGKPIYHTNVMMSVGTALAVVCVASIHQEEERKRVLGSLERAGKEIIDISFEQMGRFAGNVLEVQNANGEALMVMSEQAREAFTEAQRAMIERHARIVSAPIPTIEEAGGGSARCMIAEVFLPVKEGV